MKLVKRLIHQAMAHTPYVIVQRDLVGPDPFETMAQGLIARDTDGVFLDVGANDGQTSLKLRGLFPKAHVHAFEPGVDAYTRLRSAVEADGRIHCHQVAMGRVRGTATLHNNLGDVTNSLLANDREIDRFAPIEAVRPTGETTVEVITADEFCNALGIDLLELLKIDCQGYDHEVIAGAERLLSRKRVRVVLFEAAWVPLYVGQGRFEDTCATLRNHGYRFAGMYQQAVVRNRGFAWGDALFVVE